MVAALTAPNIVAIAEVHGVSVVVAVVLRTKPIVVVAETVCVATTQFIKLIVQIHLSVGTLVSVITSTADVLQFIPIREIPTATT